MVCQQYTAVQLDWWHICMMTLQSGGVEKVKAELEKEERELMRSKEATQQQLKVLQV